jgi:hypothetical protein
MSKKKENYTGRIHEHPNAGKGNFAKNPQNINRKGRPRKMVSGIITELKERGVEKVSPADVKEVFLMLINLEKNEIEEISEDEKQPIITKIVSKEMLSGKGFDIIEKMLDRAIGKSNENINIDSQVPLSINLNVQRRQKND